MKKHTPNILSIGATALVIAVIVGILIHNKQKSEAQVYRPDPNRAVQVGIDTVRERSLSISYQYIGTFSPNREITIAAQTQGNIIEVGAEEGEYIEAGDFIAQIDDAHYQAQLLAAQAKYENARLQFQRYQMASSGEGVSQIHVDNARTEMKIAEAQVEQLKVEIERSRITAPFSGTITEHHFDLGQTVTPGNPLLKLSDLSDLKLVISVPESEIGYFREGQPVTVYTDNFPDASFQGKVTLAGKTADESHKFTVKIRVENKNELLRAGMYGRTTINQTQESILVIPRTALLGSAQRPQVFVVQDRVARLQEIETGKSNDQMIGVVTGLKEGEIVVTSGQINITDGTKVQATPR